MKANLILLSILSFFACNNAGDQVTSSGLTNPNNQLEPIIVYDTIPEELSKGELLLANARKKLIAQKENKPEVRKSENRMLASLLVKYQEADDLTEKELQGFLMIDPIDLRNSAELSEMYNEALFNVVNQNNRLFAKELIRQPAIAEKLAFQFSNPVNDQIKKDFILNKTRNEYENQIDNRINEIEDERLIMQYYTEKRKVYGELEGDKSNIKTPQNVDKIDNSKIREFENDYKINNRIPDPGMGFSPTTLPQGQIRLDGINIDLNQLQVNDQLNESLNQRTLRELQNSTELRRRSSGNNF